MGVSDELLSLVQDSASICNYLDMPLQHISANVLKAMARPLGGKGTRKLIEGIRSNFPSIALRTTFIVGYPGESEADVEELESYILEGHFAHVGVFGYSHEPEAASASLPGRLEEEVITERRERLLKAQESVVDRHLQSYLGKRMKVLLEGPHPETDLLLAGRSEWQGPDVDGLVIINDGPEGLVPGQFIDVEVTDYKGCDLVATAL